MSWQATRWARHQQAGGLARKAVLIALADHASERGRAYPTVETIASNIEADKKTVRLAIRHLLEDGLILDTGKRTGANGKVAIYQLSMPSWVQPESIQATKIGSQFIGESVPNPELGTLNPQKKALGTYVPPPADGPLAGSLNSLLTSLSPQKDGTQEPVWFGEIRAIYPGTTIDRDLKHIEKWARKKKKPFTRDLVLNALRRHPPKIPGQQDGYLYHGKFIGKKQANALAAKDPDTINEFLPAIKHGRIVTQLQPHGTTNNQ